MSLTFTIVCILGLGLYSGALLINAEDDVLMKLLESLQDEVKSDESFEMPADVKLEFNVGDREVFLDLRRNDNIPQNIQTIVVANGKETIWKSNRDEIYAAYTDVKSKASIVMVRERSSDKILNHYRGNFQIDNEVFELMPQSDASLRRNSLPVGITSLDIDGLDHVVARDGTVDGAVYDNERETVASILLKMKSRASPTKQMRSQKFTVDLLAVVDYSLYSEGGQFSRMANRADKMQLLTYFFVTVVNGIDHRLKSIEDPDYSIGARPVGVYVTTTASDSPWTSDPSLQATFGGVVYTNITKALQLFQAWSLPSNTNRPSSFVFDHASLFSANLFYEGVDNGEPDTAAGQAQPGGICVPGLSVSVVHERGLYSTIQTTIHELGHNLGAGHDESGECPSSDQYIMATNAAALSHNDPNFNNPYTFSSCSKKQIKAHLLGIDPSKNCLLTASPSPVPVPFTTDLAGQVFPPDRQCEGLYGAGSFYCVGIDTNPMICREISCWNPAESACRRDAEHRAYHGTTCGNHKWCSKGVCTQDDAAPAADESCLYGDFQGTLKVDKITCAQAGKQVPYRCYKDLATTCCKTCEAIKDSSKPGCEYGDLTPAPCSAMPVSQCINADVAAKCCATCGSGKSRNTDDADCKYGDLKDCSSVIDQPGGGNLCYQESQASLCCATCPKIKTTLEGCEYGDKVPWCEKRATSEAECSRPGIKDNCCATCYTKYNIEPSNAGKSEALEARIDEAIEELEKFLGKT